MSDTAKALEHRAIVDRLRQRAGAAPSPWQQAAIRANAIRAARDHLGLVGADRAASLRAEQRWLQAAAGDGRATTGKVSQRSGAGAATVADISPSSRENVLSGYAAVFNSWTEISSISEGWFLERIAPGAFDRTLRSGRRLVAQYDHGTNARVSSLPLGPVRARPDARGLFYEVDLLIDASYVRDLLPAARAGLFGSSFRFRVVADEWRDPPSASAANPQRLAERTLTDVDLIELGPVLHPAYPQAGPVSVGRNDDAAARRRIIAIHHRRARLAAAAA